MESNGELASREPAGGMSHEQQVVKKKVVGKPWLGSAFPTVVLPITQPSTTVAFSKAPEHPGLGIPVACLFFATNSLGTFQSVLAAVLCLIAQPQQLPPFCLCLLDPSYNDGVVLELQCFV